MEQDTNQEEDIVAHGSLEVQLRAENSELREGFEKALQEAEALKKQNEALLKEREDTALDQQMTKAMTEAEKLKAAADAYKLDLLQQKLAEREWDMQQAKERASALDQDNQALQQSMAQLKAEQQGHLVQMDTLKRENMRLKEKQDHGTATQGEAAKDSALPEPEAADKPSRGAMEDLAAQLNELAGQSDNHALMIAAANALRNASVLDAQLRRAREEKDRLAKEVTELNETVFSRSFKAPSAWAEREVKYKAEKRDWSSNVQRLQTTIERLREENLGYRAANKAAEFESQMKELQEQVRAADQAKIVAQREMHEMQIEMRKRAGMMQQPAVHAQVDAEGIQAIIQEMESQGIGVAQPAATIRQIATQLSTRGSGHSTPGNTGSPIRLVSSFPVPSNVEGIIMDYDDRHIGPSKPSPQSKQRRRSHSAQLSADASASLGNNHLSRNPAPGLVGSVRGHIELDAHGNPVNGLMHRGEHVARLPSHLSGESPEPGAEAASGRSIAQHVAAIPHQSAAAPAPRPPPTASGSISQQPTVPAITDAAPVGAAGIWNEVPDERDPSTVFQQPPAAPQPAAASSAEAGGSHSPEAHVSPAGTHEWPDQAGDPPLSRAPPAPAHANAPPGSQPEARDSQPGSPSAGPPAVGRTASSGADSAGQAPLPQRPSLVHHIHDTRSMPNPPASVIGSDISPTPPAYWSDDPHEWYESSTGPPARRVPAAELFTGLRAPATSSDRPEAESATESDDLVAPADARPVPEPEAGQPSSTEDTPGGQASGAEQGVHAEPSIGSASDAAPLQALPDTPSEEQPAAPLEADSAAGATDAGPFEPGAQPTSEPDAQPAGAVAAAGASEDDAAVASQREQLEQAEGATSLAAELSGILQAADQDDSLEPVGEGARDESGSEQQADLSAAERGAAEAEAQSAAARRAAMIVTPFAAHSSSEITPAPLPGSEPSMPEAGVPGGPSRADSMDNWTREHLKQEQSAVDSEIVKIMSENDPGALRLKNAELQSRMDMYDAQVEKLQRALERADDEKARLEQQLAEAAAPAPALEPAPSSSSASLPPPPLKTLPSMKDRLMSVMGRSSSISSAQDPTQKLQEAEVALAEARKEVAELAEARTALTLKVQEISARMKQGEMPTPAELDAALAPLATAAASRGTRRISSFARGLDGPEGLTDEELEVFRLREENESLMEALVRTKIEAAESQGEYLKTRRALLRSIEKQAGMASKIEEMRDAFRDGNTAGVTGLLDAAGKQRLASYSGDIESLGERSLF